MLSLSRALTGALCCALWGFAINAGAVTLLSDNRQIRDISDTGTTTLLPLASFADWTHPAQTSSVGVNGFSGFGSGVAESDFSFFISDSIFDVTFSATQGTTIDLGGSLSGEDGSFGLGESVVQLFAGTSTSAPLLFSSVGGNGQVVDFAFSDTLPGGDYRLRVFTDLVPGGGTTGAWDFQAAFVSAVPVPAAFWLFGCGVALLLRAGRR